MDTGNGFRERDGSRHDKSTADISNSSDMSMSTARDGKTTDPERRKERQDRRAAKVKRREERERQKLLDEKLSRKEARRITREERAERRAARAKEEEAKKMYEASSSELSSSLDDGDDDASYNISNGSKKENKKKDESSTNKKKKYSAVSFNYSSFLANRDKKSFFNVPAGKLPRFDGTNFAKWKHLMRAYLIGLHPGLWEIVCRGFEPPKDPEEPTNDELAAVHLNGQATSILLSALEGNEYNRVMNVDVAKQIWDTLHLAHEGVDKVRKAKIDLLMPKLNRFVIVEGEGAQEMFDS